MLASSTTPATTQAFKPVFFTDSPELQKGVGPMDPDPPTEFLKTDSGLRYRILRKSNGPKPKMSDTVMVNYRGWLSNGKVFDSSYDRGQPTSFGLDSVIAGWTEGMQLVGVGGMIELWVPSRLGYGAAGSPGSVLPHANLHFVVELLRVK
jgi:FKBP-type peptidyl-prolyl cis-trans isomerase FkpA